MMAAITVMATTTAATATTAAAAAIAAAAATMTEGHRLVVTAQQSDADDREENRETKYNNPVHPQILQLLTGTVSENYNFLPSRRSHRDNRRLSVAMRPKAWRFATSHVPRFGSLLSNSEGYEGYSDRKD